MIIIGPESIKFLFVATSITQFQIRPIVPGLSRQPFSAIRFPAISDIDILVDIYIYSRVESSLAMGVPEIVTVVVSM